MRCATAQNAPGRSWDWTAPNHRTTSTTEPKAGPTRRLLASRAWAIARFVTVRVYESILPGAVTFGRGTPAAPRIGSLGWPHDPRADRLGRGQPGPGRGV